MILFVIPNPGLISIYDYDSN